jgi:hypothetical protein
MSERKASLQDKSLGYLCGGVIRVLTALRSCALLLFALARTEVSYGPALYDINDSNNERTYFNRAHAAFTHEVTQAQQDF